MSKLIPCPFCGENPKEGIEGNSFYIRCEGAFCSMASIYGPVFATASIIDTWNTRTPLPGYAMIPVEPTEDMIYQLRVFCDEEDYFLKAGYKAMIEAAGEGK